MTDNHQEGNARDWKRLVLRVVLVEHDLDMDAAVAQIGSLMNDKDSLSQMVMSAEPGALDTAQQVAELLADGFLE